MNQCPGSIPGQGKAFLIQVNWINFTFLL